jgi:hypothetical protein
MPTELTLSYGKKPIRALLDEDGLWLAATDLYAANRLWTDRDTLARFGPEHLRLLSFPSEAGPVRLTAVSPLGALTVAAYLKGWKQGRILDAWVRRETNRLAEEHGFAPLGMEFLADRTMPERPRVSSSLYLPWHELRSHSYGLERREANPDEPALVDEDQNFPEPVSEEERKASKAAFDAAWDEWQRGGCEDEDLFLRLARTKPRGS